MRCSPRGTASARERRGTSRKGRGSRPPSLRGSRRARVWLPARRIVMLQKSVGDVWPRISSANALQKERSGSSERGPSSERGSAVETVGRHVERKARRESASPVRRCRTGTRPRVARDRHPAVQTSPKAVLGSRDRGCNDHRILRRVPTDGRHPGSSRGVTFHEAASRVVLALFRILRPARRGQTPTRAARLQLPRRQERREETTGCDWGVRGSIASAPREENARAREPSREAKGTRTRV
jgi:hypothetical protein